MKIPTIKSFLASNDSFLWFWIISFFISLFIKDNFVRSGWFFLYNCISLVWGIYILRVDARNERVKKIKNVENKQPITLVDNQPPKVQEVTIQEIARLRSLIKAQSDYIDFLGGEINGSATFLFIHGIVCPPDTVKKGEELRGQIDRYKKAQEM